MTLENIIESLNKYIIEERKNRNIDCKDFLIAQKSLIPTPMFKAFKEYKVIIWLLNPKNKNKTAVFQYTKTDKFLEGEDKNITLANKEICTGLFSLCRDSKFNDLIEGKYGDINE